MQGQNRDLFEQRLARIREAQGTAPAQPQRGGNRFGRWLAMLVLIAAGGVAAGQFAPDALRLVGAATVASEPAGGDVTLAAAVPAPDLMARITALFTGADPTAPQPTLPEEFLPPAPEGWIRATRSDALNPDTMAALQAAWAALPPEGRIPLDQHAGLARLAEFLAAQGSDDMESRALSKTRTRAMYLAPDGTFLSVTLRFRAQRAPFGPPGDNVAWGQTLRREAKKDAGTGEIVEALTLGGIPVVNRTRPAGKSLLARPIGKDLDIPNGMKLTAALSHRAEVGMVGVATPADAGALLAAFDAAALARLLE